MISFIKIGKIHQCMDRMAAIAARAPKEIMKMMGYKEMWDMLGMWPMFSQTYGLISKKRVRGFFLMGGYFQKSGILMLEMGHVPNDRGRG